MGKKKKNLLVVYLEYIPFMCLYGFYRILPLHYAYAVAKFFFGILYWIYPRMRNRTLQHIKHSGIETDPQKIYKLARANYDSFAKLFVEIIKFDQYYNDFNMTVTGNPAGVDVFYGTNKQQLIIVTAHYGNWEVAGATMSYLTGRIFTAIMRPFDNPKIGKVILDHRASDRHRMVDKSGGVRGLIKALRQDHNVAILVDQHASYDEGIVVDFFGHPACTHVTPALLQLKLGVTILPLLIRRKSDNFEFEVVVDEPIDYKPTNNHEADVRNIVVLYTNALERLIRKDPVQWLWCHRRWDDINRSPAPYLTSAKTNADTQPDTNPDSSEKKTANA